MSTGNQRFEPVLTLPVGRLCESGLLVMDYRQPFDVIHSHDFYELVLVRNGLGLHVLRDGKYAIRRGDIFLVRPGQAHTYEDVKNLDIVNILFLPDKLKLQFDDLPDTAGYYSLFEAGPRLSRRYRSQSPLSLNDAQLKLAEEIIMEIQLEQKRKAPGHEYFRKVAFMRLIGMLCRAFSDKDNSSSEELAGISRIIRYFEQHYPHCIKLEDLCPVCGKSVSTIVRLFREGLGRSPIEYLIALRLEKAAVKLAESDASITEIASAVGFEDSNYFSKMFRRKYGVPPRTYRKNCG
ncbi:MAG: helix-turn-helix domain-containing protein [Victivallales bacterium]|jgi:AraC-like DNA-binding protein|nr:helix-turn-helix domain-containing protein [Victivallales bacterium]